MNAFILTLEKSGKIKFLLSEILSELAKAEAEGALCAVLGVKILGPFSVLSNNCLKPRGENSFRMSFRVS